MPHTPASPQPEILPGNHYCKDSALYIRGLTATFSICTVELNIFLLIFWGFFMYRLKSYYKYVCSNLAVLLSDCDPVKIILSHFQFHESKK